jgi:4-diphosphocytidyl-2-C-methyl-D-erythritol kinase
MSASAPSVHVKAPGKINVFMRVGSLQEDGYHEVATAYQAVSLCEEVRASLAPDFSVAFDGPVDCSRLATDGSNIAIKAARLLARAAGYRGGVHLDITKRVPIAGGMGGGSADAAATLVACDALWATDVGRDTLHSLAAKLGADVPFALAGGTAIGTGKGDRLSPALAKGQFHWVLVLADSGMSTPRVYEELDRHRERHALDIFPASVQPTVDAGVLQALRAGDPHMLAESLHNDLQAPRCTSRPPCRACSSSGSATAPSPGSSRDPGRRSPSSPRTSTPPSRCRSRCPPPACGCSASPARSSARE